MKINHDNLRKTSFHGPGQMFSAWVMLAIIAFGCVSGLLSVGSSAVINAATTNSGSLTVGKTVATDDTTKAYTNSDITNASNTSTYYTGSNMITNWDTGTLTLTDAGGVNGIGGKKGDSWATFKNAVTMTKPLNLSFSMKAVPNAVQNSYVQVGAWLGAYFVPMGTTSFNYQNSTGGPTNTAISGTANSVFLGRNYWYNGSGGTIAQISQTDSSVNQSNVATGDTVFAPTNSGEAVTITWTPTLVGTSTTKGTLSMTIVSGTNSTVSKTISGTVTMQNNMLLGFSGDASGYGSKMTIWNVTSSTSALPANGNVTVNYVDSKTNQIAASSTINAKVGDVIGVNNGGVSSADTYDYTAPAISKYNYSSVTSPVPVTAYSGSSQTITVTYAQQLAWWNYNWAYNTYGAYSDATKYAPALNSWSQAGAIGDAYTTPSPKAPAGYHIAGFKSVSNTLTTTDQNGTHPLTSGYYWTPDTVNGNSSNGTMASSTADAMSKAITYAGGKLLSDGSQSDPGYNVGTVDSHNHFSIYIEANKETATLTYKDGSTTFWVTTNL